MSTETSQSYVPQVLENRYIKVKVLEDYLNGDPSKFGDKWTMKVERDNKITISVLKKLAEDEILKIQMKSFPNNFQGAFFSPS